MEPVPKDPTEHHCKNSCGATSMFWRPEPSSKPPDWPLEAQPCSEKEEEEEEEENEVSDCVPSSETWTVILWDTIPSLTTCVLAVHESPATWQLLSWHSHHKSPATCQIVSWHSLHESPVTWQLVSSHSLHESPVTWQFVSSQSLHESPVTWQLVSPYSL